MGKTKEWLNKYSIRKGCYHCGAELKTIAEKISRTCSVCAGEAREGFAQMGEGKFKKGFSSVTNVLFQNNNEDEAIAQKKVLQEKIRGAISKKEMKIRQQLKKKGLTLKEIDMGLEEFKNNL